MNEFIESQQSARHLVWAEVRGDPGIASPLKGLPVFMQNSFSSERLHVARLCVEPSPDSRLRLFTPLQRPLC